MVFLRFLLQKNAWTMRMFVLCIVLFLQGCMTGLIRETSPERQKLLDVDVNNIDNLSLQALSQSQPISIEDGSRQQKEESLEREAAKQVVSLSLADIRAAALANNLQLRVDLVNPTLAKEKYLEERAKFEAAFYGGVGYSNSLTPTSSELVGSQSSSTQYEIGITQPLPTGGRVKIALPGNRYETDNKYSTLNPAFETDLSFSISQPLLRGGGASVNTHSIRVARLTEKITEAETKLAAIRVLAEADRAYWRVFGASKTLEVSQQQYQIALRQLEEAKLRVKSKAAPQIEITRAESGAAARLESIILALTGLRLYERDLRRIMNRADLPMDATTAILPLTDPSPLGLRLNANQLVKFAIQNRMEMLELELQLCIDESAIDYTKNARLPSVVMDYSYNVNGLGKTFGDSYGRMIDADYPNWSIGLTGEIPLGNRAAGARFRQALLAKVQRLATRDLRKQAIEQEVYNAIDQLDQNWQRILASRQEVLFAARTYEAERKQFELGVRTSTDVLYAAERLAYAQQREIEALVDYQIAQVDIAYATGTLLGEAGVRWQPVER